MADGGLSLPGVTMVAGGLVLAYSGINDPEGGPLGMVRAIVRGQTPTLRPKVISNLGGGTTVPVGTSSGVPGGSAVRDRVVAVAKSYLGDPWKFAGKSHSGIDCSGLVLVAYRDGAGIALPHLATAQMARGTRIPRDQVRPGDLVGWGVPGNYPHIALAIGNDQEIDSPHLGAVVKIDKIDRKSVSGFGYPDIVRILDDTLVTV